MRKNVSAKQQESLHGAKRMQQLGRAACAKAQETSHAAAAVRAKQ